jgi:glycosyltransferase involved in cell wall biosynthesis
VPQPWDELSERVVMVARYADRDGIARYAEQLAASHDADRSFLRVGIPEGPGDHHRALHRGPRALWLMRDAGRDDDILVHYHPHYYVRGGPLSMLLCHASWALLATLRHVTFVVHEPDAHKPGGIVELARRWAWRTARRLIFHTDWERERHRRRFGCGARQEQVVVEHGDFFSTTVRLTRESARRELGLPLERTILLMIGFLSAVDPDKGYDRAIDALRATHEPSLLLYIVGSPIRDDPVTHELTARLRDTTAESDQVFFHETYVDDEEFDAWLLAADAVLTPYRTSSSSGVVARAHLLGTRVIMSDVGGLPAQAREADLLFGSEPELVQILRGLVDGDSRTIRR